jgi:hypothetical protein
MRFSTRVSDHIRSNVIGYIALFCFAIGGTAYATHPGGANTISSGDVIDGQVKTADLGNGEVKVADVGQAAVATDELKNDGVTGAKVAASTLTTTDLENETLTASDVAPNSLSSGRILDASLTGADVKDNALKGADIDEATLDVGDAARAYAHVGAPNCTGTPGTCEIFKSKGIASVTRDSTGQYCVTAPGIDQGSAPAAVTVDWSTTTPPAGNASAMVGAFDQCGPAGKAYRVVTERQPLKTVDVAGGTGSTVVAGPATLADDVGFTIVIP